MDNIFINVVEEYKLTYSDCRIKIEDKLHIYEEFKAVSLRCLKWILDGYEYSVFNTEIISANGIIVIDVFFKISRHRFKDSKVLYYNVAKPCITFTFGLDPNMPFHFHKLTYIGSLLYTKLSRRLKSFHDEFEKTYSCVSELTLQLDLMGV